MNQKVLLFNGYLSKGAAVLLASVATPVCTRFDRWAVELLEAEEASLAIAKSVRTSAQHSSNALASELRSLA